MLESTAKTTTEPPATQAAAAIVEPAAPGAKPLTHRLDRQSIINFLILIIVAAGGLYLLANERVNLWDRDEPRYAQTSRQMLQSHDWVVPTLLDKPRTAKPVFIYWCQTASMWLLGDKVQAPPTPTTVFAVRLPSSVAMILVLILLAIVLYRYAGPRRALWTLLVFSTSFLVILSAKMCLTDAVLLLWTTIALLCLYAIYRGNRSWTLTIVFWSATGLGALTKGPVELAVILTAMIALAAMDFDLRRQSNGQRHLAAEAGISLRKQFNGAGWAWLAGIIFGTIAEFLELVVQGSWRAVRQWWWRLRPIAGVLILAAICAPWMILVSRRSPGFLTTAFSHEIFDRMSQPLEQHKGPPGYYLVTIFAFFFPWSLLLPSALIVAFRQRRRPQIRFALACILGPWVMFEFIATKLPHYMLPAYAPLAFLVGEAIIVMSRRIGQSARRPVLPMLAVAIWAMAVLGLCAAPWVATKWFDLPRAGAIALLGLTLIGLLWIAAVFFRFHRRNLPGAVAAMGIGMALFVAMLYGGYIPNAPFLRVPQRIADVLIANGAIAPGQEIMLGYKELSTIFYQGGTMRAERENNFLKDPRSYPWPQWIIMSGDLWKKTRQQRIGRLGRVTTIRGLNYAGGMKKVDVWILHK